MKKHPYLLALCLTALGFTAFGQRTTSQLADDCKDVPALTSNHGMVIDFAEKLSPAFEQNLEAKLRAFEAKSTIEVALVTVPQSIDYDGNEYATKMLNCYGIGKAPLNNGLLIVIGFGKPHRIVAIATGYGVEGQMTDLQAGRIVDKAKELLKAGKPEEAALLLVDQSISTLSQSPEEVQSSKDKLSQAKEDRVEESWAWLWNTLLYLLIITFLAFGVYYEIKNQTARKDAKKWRVAIDEAYARFALTGKDIPKWAQKEFEQKEKAISEARESFERELAEKLKKFLKFNKEERAYFEDYYVNPIFVLIREGSSIKEKVAMYRNGSCVKFELWSQALESLHEFHTHLVEAGFRIKPFEIMFQELHSQWTEWEKKEAANLFEADDYRTVYELSETMVANCNEQLSKLKVFEQQQVIIATNTDKEIARIAQLRGSIKPALATIHSLQKLCPESVWGELLAKVNTANSEIDTIKQQLEYANKQNTHEVGDYENAWKNYQLALGNIEAMKLALETTIPQTLADQTEAKASINECLRLIDIAANSAATATAREHADDNDARYDRALMLIAKLKPLTEHKIEDWSVLNEQLRNLLREFDSITRDANAEVDAYFAAIERRKREAEEAERRKREEEAAARRRQEEEDERRRSYSSSSNYSSGGYSSSSSNSSFSFGGGSGGGGGASSDW